MGASSSSDESTRGEHAFNVGGSVHGSGPGRPQEERCHSKAALPRPEPPQHPAQQPLERQQSGPEESQSRHSIEPQELFSDLEDPGDSGMTGLSMLSSHCNDAEAAVEQTSLLDGRAGEQPYQLGSALNSPVALGQVAVRSPADKGSSEFASGPPQQEASAACSDSGASSPRGPEPQAPDVASLASLAAGKAERLLEEQVAEDGSDGEEASGDEEFSSDLDEELLLRLGASGRAVQSIRRSSTSESSALRSEEDDLKLPM